MKVLPQNEEVLNIVKEGFKDSFVTEYVQSEGRTLHQQSLCYSFSSHLAYSIDFGGCLCSMKEKYS